MRVRLLGTYRVLSRRALVEFGFDGHPFAASRTITALERRSLIASSLIPRGRHGYQVYSLTPAGRDLIAERRRRRDRRDEQRLWAGFGDARQLAHDHRVFEAVMQDTEKLRAEGGRIRRVRLEPELRGLLSVAGETARASGGPDAATAARCQEARRIGLVVFDREVPLPDALIKVEDARGQVVVRSIEVASSSYTRVQVRAKGLAGFRVYSIPGFRRQQRLRRVGSIERDEIPLSWGEGVDGLRWITTLRAPTLRKLVNTGTVTPSLFDERDLAKDLETIAAATRRENRPLRGAAAIGVRVGKVINRYKMAKHFVTEITDERFTFRRNEEKIATEKQLDGIYIIRSNVEPEQFDAAQTVRAYKDLSKVERAFRCFKSVDLKVRPLHHRRADRVRAHVLLCMLAYYVEWHMRRALAPLLFDNHDPAAAEQQRTSVVAPARRSPAALAKARRKRTDDDLPVHSFRTMLTDLGTLAANTMQVASGGATFTLQTKPTPLQQCCFELLGLTPRM